jgi:hypothetical protein
MTFAPKYELQDPVWERRGQFHILPRLLIWNDFPDHSYAGHEWEKPEIEVADVIK